MSEMSLAAMIAAAHAALNSWDIPSIAHAFAAPPRYGRKPSGVAAAKRAKKRRNNIAKRAAK
jgi:hypothetical protein